MLSIENERGRETDREGGDRESELKNESPKGVEHFWHNEWLIARTSVKGEATGEEAKETQQTKMLPF